MEKVVTKHHLPFGKYKGQRWISVINQDIKYVLWFIDAMEVSFPGYVLNHLINRVRKPVKPIKGYSGTRNLRCISRRLKNN